MPEQRPLLDVEPVQLAPPPQTPPPKPPSLAGRAVLLLALLAGIPLLGLLLTALFIGLNWLVWKAGRVNLGLVIAAVAVPIALGRAFFAMLRKPPADPDEVEVPAQAEPQLHAEAKRLAEAAGTRPPDRIVVIPEVNAYVHENGPLFGLVKGTRTLGIGVPLLDALTVTELRAVLGHEFGHFASGDTKLGPLAWRTEVALVEILRRLSGFSGTVFLWYFKLQYRVGAAIRRGQEVVADRAAVRIAGRQAAANALRKVQLAGAIDSLNMEAYLVPLLQSGHRPPELATSFRSLLSQRTRVDWAEQATARAEDPDPYASHPPTAERIRRIEALPELNPDAAAQQDDRAAAALFADPDRWVRAAHENWLRVRAGDAKLDTADWDRWPELILLPEHQRLAADTDAALAQLGFEPSVPGIRQAVDADRHRDLSAKLVAAGWRAGAAGNSADLLYAAVLAAVSNETTKAGTHRWALSWSGDAELHAVDGGNVDVHDRVAAAVEGDWSRVDELLAGSATPARRRRRTRAEREAQAADADTPQPRPQPQPRPEADDLPMPPTPPFEGAADGAWRATLPHGIRTDPKVAVHPDRIEWGKDVIPFAGIRSVEFDLNREAATLGFTVKVTTNDDKTHKLRAGGTGSAKRDLIADTYGYLIDLFIAAVAPRRHQEIADDLRKGGTFQVAGITMTSEGVRFKKDPLTPWANVTGPLETEPGQIGFGFGNDLINVPVAAKDAFLLPGLVPYLRALFA